MRRLLVISLALALLLTGCAQILPKAVIYPSITPDITAAGSIPVTRTFTFEGKPVTLRVTVDKSLYVGAKRATKSVLEFGGTSDWIAKYFPALVFEKHQDPFFASLLAALRAVRDQRGLDSDRYAELMTVFVQSLTYHTDPVNLEPKYPVETFVEGAGDCDDKVLLLSGLLAREGYDVSALLFQPEKHVALGIRSADLGYKGTGYAYVETTAPGFVGMVPDSFAGGVVLKSAPRVLKIGSGTVPYTAGAQVAAILTAHQKALDEAAGLTRQLKGADGSLTQLKDEVVSMQKQLESRLAAGQVTEYNSALPGYNALATQYNGALRERNVLADRYNALAGADRAFVRGMNDRPGTYAILMALGL